MNDYWNFGGTITNKALAQKDYGYESVPTTSHTEIIGGKKYVVVSHYVGGKDFKKVFSDLAFRQVLTEMQNSAD